MAGALAPNFAERVARSIAHDRKPLLKSAVDNVQTNFERAKRVTGVTAKTAARRIVADVVADRDTKEHVARTVSLLPEKVGVFRLRNGPLLGLYVPRLDLGPKSKEIVNKPWLHYV